MAPKIHDLLLIFQVSMHLRYVLKRTWFTCLRVPNASNEYSWRDKQRYMYLRLRRLVSSYNKHLFHKLHHERKLILQATVRKTLTWSLNNSCPDSRPLESEICSAVKLSVVTWTVSVDLSKT